MESKGVGMEENELKSRSFRYEDYNTRRAFLRSYPLFQRDEEDQEQTKAKEETAKAAMKEKKLKKHMKKILVAVIHWGEERAIIIRRIKNKATVYVITCLPIGLKAPTALISA